MPYKNPDDKKAHNKAWRKANPEKARAYIKSWREANPEKVRATTKAWQEANLEKARATTKAWQKANPEKIRATTKAWKKANPEKERAYRKARKARDPAYVMKNRLRCRLRSAINRAQTTKSDATMNLIGCTQAELIRHLESTFTEGMSWDVRWWLHVDHVIPLSSFDLTDTVQQKAAMNFKNLQMLWGHDNLRKSNKMPIPLDIVSNS